MIDEMQKKNDQLQSKVDQIQQEKDLLQSVFLTLRGCAFFRIINPHLPAAPHIFLHSNM